MRMDSKSHKAKKFSTRNIYNKRATRSMCMPGFSFWFVDVVSLLFLCMFLKQGDQVMMQMLRWWGGGKIESHRIQGHQRRVNNPEYIYQRERWVWCASLQMWGLIQVRQYSGSLADREKWYFTGKILNLTNISVLYISSFWKHHKPIYT